MTLKKYPSIVIFPQCPAKSSWANVKRNDEMLTGKKFDFFKEISENKQLIMVEKLLDFIQKYNIDSSRRYVGGLSMGGMGTFELVEETLIILQLLSNFRAAIQIGLII